MSSDKSIVCLMGTVRVKLHDELYLYFINRRFQNNKFHEKFRKKFLFGGFAIVQKHDQIQICVACLIEYVWIRKIREKLQRGRFNSI